MLSCHEIGEKASDYLDRNLPWWTRAQVRMHLFLCENCWRHVAQLRLVVKTLRLSAKHEDSARESTDKTVQFLRSRRQH